MMLCWSETIFCVFTEDILDIEGGTFLMSSCFCDQEPQELVILITRRTETKMLTDNKALDQK